MNYLQALYETYENNLDEVGKKSSKTTRDGKKEIEYMLLPISHTTQTAHIEVTVDENGEFYEANVIDKINTVLPFTEESGARAGKNYVPHMLHDKLMFVAGDFVKYTGQEDKKEAYQKYIYQLEEWCNSEFSHPDVCSIYHYLKKGTLIRDLVENKVLHLNQSDILMEKWIPAGEKMKPDIFSVIAGGQESAFVRFNVHHPISRADNVWTNQEIFNRYIDFYNTKLKEKDLCYISGKSAPLIMKHPNKLRNSGDKSKLISANDSSGFTYRGRFINPLEAANISYEVSQKAHNALKWLVDKQGKTVDGRVFLVWGTKKVEIPQASDDLIDLESLDFEMDIETAIEQKAETRKMLAEKYGRVISGVGADVSNVEKSDSEAKVFILTIDAATPGRLAVLYYRDLELKEYFDRLLTWHEECSWRHFKKVGDIWKEYYGSPSFYTIASAAYGPRPSDKLIKTIMERLLPCVIDQRPIPLDIVRSAIMRASNPLAFDGNWEWQQAVSVACSLVKKQYKKEGFTVALDKSITDRNYLFGRLLAVADVLERNVLSNEEKNRPTNALRYMNAFVKQPQRVWNTIHSNLQPYMMRLGNNSRYYSDLLQEITSKFNIEEFNNNALNGKYLLGYYSQRQDMYTKKDIKAEGENQ